MAISGLKTRKPTGRVPWPCILLEGEEKAGKSWALAQLSTSDRIGALYWIDLNEGAGDEYGAIPGANYSYAQVLAAVQAVKAEARRVADAGEPPVVLGIDNGSAIWDGLKDGASARGEVRPQPRAAQARPPRRDRHQPEPVERRRCPLAQAADRAAHLPGHRGGDRPRQGGHRGRRQRPLDRGQKTWSVQTHREFP
jgi:hypothetical protein